MSTGVIYARYSCEKQTENSILGQIRECKEFAKKNDIEIIDIYKDEAISGRTAEKRPSFMRMINDANKHCFENIIVWKGDRFSRSRADAAKYKSELKKLGVRVLSATEANVTGPEAVLMDGINEAFAEYFSVELAAKVERGMTQNALDGKFNGGRLPFGFKLDQNRKIVIDENNAEIVKYLFERYANFNVRIIELVNELKLKGVVGNYGTPITKSAMSRILSNRRYIGEYDFKGTKNNTMFPPIVDIKTFNLVQDKLRKNRSSSGAYRVRAHYLLRDKLFCGECLSPLKSAGGTSKSGARRKYYECVGKRNHICDLPVLDKESIETAVIQKIFDFLSDKANINHVIQQLISFDSKRTPEMERMQKVIDETDNKIKNYMVALESGVNIDIAVNRLKELQDIKKKQEIEFKNQSVLNRTYTVDEYKEFFKNCLNIKKLDDESKQYLINMFIEKVFIYKDKTIKIIFHFVDKSVQLDSSVGVPLEERSVHQITK